MALAPRLEPGAGHVKLDLAGGRQDFAKGARLVG